MYVHIVDRSRTTARPNIALCGRRVCAAREYRATRSPFVVDDRSVCPRCRYIAATTLYQDVLPLRLVREWKW